MRVPSAIFIATIGFIMASCSYQSKRENTSNNQLIISPSLESSYVKSLAKAKELSHLNIFISIDENINEAALPLGRLSGMTIALKDTIHATGLPNTAGTKGLENFIPREDAPAVKRLKDEGALIFGKANMHELAFGITSNNGYFGATRNPYDISRFPGGSSGGSAAAVAARITRAAIAGDTGGSIRIPAALCGVIGFRPSLGRYQDEAITPISHTRDVIGPVALTMNDITLLDSVLANKPEVTKAAKLNSLRIGIARNPFYLNLNPETAVAMEAALQKLKDAGVTLVEFDLPEVTELVKKTGGPIALYEVVKDMPVYLKKYNVGINFFELANQTISPDVHGLFKKLAQDENENGKPDGLIPQIVYNQAMVHRKELADLYSHYFKSNNLDAMVFPTTILPAAPIEGSIDTVEHNGERISTFSAYTRNTEPASIAGLPGISLPIGLTKSGLPLSMELDSATDNDEHLLAIARAIAPLFAPLSPPNVN